MAAVVLHKSSIELIPSIPIHSKMLMPFLQKFLFFFACIYTGHLSDSKVAFVKHDGRSTVVSESVYCFWNDGRNLTVMLSYFVDNSIDYFRVRDAAVPGG
jgi:hypothetical protein